MRFRMLPAATALVAVALLVGCVPQDPVIAPVPEPSSSPVFASDEEALAAATEAYGRYVDVTDAIFAAGGDDLRDLDSVMTGKLLESTIVGFEQAKSQGLHSTGGTRFEQMRLQQYDQTSSGAEIVVVYVCEDISAVDVVDSQGRSVVSADRPNRVLYEVSFDMVQHQLLVSSRKPWSRQAC